jgi:hypothetical protein
LPATLVTLPKIPGDELAFRAFLPARFFVTPDFLADRLLTVLVGESFSFVVFFFVVFLVVIFAP